MPVTKVDTISRILNRCEDLELGFPGLVPQQVRDLPDSDIPALASEVDYRMRGQTERGQTDRYNNLIDILQRDQVRRDSSNKKTHVQELARLARQTRHETCECGNPHPRNANFYVTAIDGRKTLPLSGPYPTHAEAVAMVDEIKERAISVDPGAAFASFGTTAMNPSYDRKGILD